MAGIKTEDIHDVLGPSLPLPPDAEVVALYRDIADNGVLVPVVLDSQHRVIDGALRVAAARAAGIKDIPVIVRKIGEDDARAERLRLNFHRRHLSRDQRDAVIIAELRRAPERADRVVASVVGTTPAVVRRCRKALEETGSIPSVEQLVKGDGRLVRKVRGANGPEYLTVEQRQAIRALLIGAELLGSGGETSNREVARRLRVRLTDVVAERRELEKSGHLEPKPVREGRNGRLSVVPTTIVVPLSAAATLAELAQVVAREQAGSLLGCLAAGFGLIGTEYLRPSDAGEMLRVFRSLSEGTGPTELEWRKAVVPRAISPRIVKFLGGEGTAGFPVPCRQLVAVAVLVGASADGWRVPRSAWNGSPGALVKK